MEEAETKKSKGGSKKIFQRGLIIIGIILAGVFIFELATDDFAYSCEGLVPQVQEISEKNARASGRRIIDIVEIKELTNREGTIECSGLALFSDSTKQTINFKQYSEYDKWWVRFEPTGQPQRR